jgi:hypothetical protein
MKGIAAIAQSTGIVPVETELPWVFQFENVISPQLCDAAVAHITRLAESKSHRPGNMPWEDDDTITWQDIGDQALKARLYAYRLLLTQIASHCFQAILYPTFTDLVMWRVGRSHPEHKDNGYIFPKDNNLAIRKFSSVTYLNDGFEGGETFFRCPDDNYLVNTPKKGSVVLFASDERCPHGVTEVRSGLRFTMPIWFTDIVAHCERENGTVEPDVEFSEDTRPQPVA